MAEQVNLHKPVDAFTQSSLTLDDFLEYVSAVYYREKWATSQLVNM